MALGFTVGFISGLGAAFLLAALKDWFDQGAGR